MLFRSVVEKLKAAWDNIGKPLFDIIKAVIETAIEVLKPIIDSLFEAFKKAFDAIKTVWDNVLSPVADKIIEVIGNLIKKIEPHMDTFKACVKGAMDFVTAPIKAVIDLFDKLCGWVRTAGERVGGWISKATGKGKSIDIATNVDTTGIDSFNNIALSGQYFNARTPRAQQVNEFISGGSIVVNKTDDDMLLAMKQQNQLLNKLLDAMLSEKTTVVETQINLDGRQISKNVAPYMERSEERRVGKEC